MSAPTITALAYGVMRNQRYEEVMQIMAELSNGDIVDLWSYYTYGLSGNWPMQAWCCMDDITFSPIGKTVEQVLNRLREYDPTRQPRF